MLISKLVINYEFALNNILITDWNFNIGCVCIQKIILSQSVDVIIV